MPSNAHGAESDLLGFVASVAGEGRLRVEESLGHGFVRLRVAEAERRQAKHDIRRVEDVVVELLRNARDAGARNIYLATSREGNLRTLTMLDDGSGIPADMTERIFDARVTSKLETMSVDRWGVHGRGMALYSIRLNAVSSEVVATGEGLGTSMRVVADCSALPERADQSSLPKLVRDEGGNLALGPGPRNVMRAALELSLSSGGAVNVFVGSPSEVAATLCAHDPAGIPLHDVLFGPDDGALPVCSRLRGAADAPELARRCAALGLCMSDRTAQRVLSGEIAPLRPMLESVRSRQNASVPVDLERDRRGLRVSHEDAQAFAREVARAFDPLAESYYLRLSGEPRVRIAHDHITVSLPIEKL